MMKNPRQHPAPTKAPAPGAGPTFVAMAPRKPTAQELFFYAAFPDERDTIERELCGAYRLKPEELRGMAVDALHWRLKTYKPGLDELYDVLTKRMGERHLQQLLDRHGMTAEQLTRAVHEFSCYIKLRLCDYQRTTDM